MNHKPGHRARQNWDTANHPNLNGSVEQLRQLRSITNPQTAFQDPEHTSQCRFHNLPGLTSLAIVAGSKEPLEKMEEVGSAENAISRTSEGHAK